MTGQDTGVRVLYIGGSGRSGSTLLDRILGQVPGVCSLGEVVHLWARGVRDDERCGCGEPFSGCPFWDEVGRQAFGGWDRIDAREALALQAAIDRNRYVPMALAPRAFPRYERTLRRYGQLVIPVLAAAREVSGAEAVIDSSKHASTAYVYRALRDVDLRVLHLVRDPRGVAYSWTKQVAKPEVVGRSEFMPRFRPAKMARWWLAFNALFDLMPATGVPTMLLRYESLIARPRAETERAMRFAHLPVTAGDLGFVTDGAVELAPNHTVAGNPMRFETGRVALHLDRGWRAGLPADQIRTVERITAVLRRRYGYPRSGGDDLEGAA